MGFDGYYNTAKASSGKGQYTANLPTLSDGSYVYGGRGTSDWDHKTYTANLKYNFDDSKSLKYSYTKYKTYFGYKNPYSFVKDENGNPVYSGTVTTQHGNVITLKASNFYGYNNINERDTHALVYKDEDNKFNASFSYLNDKEERFHKRVRTKKHIPDLIGLVPAVILLIPAKFIISIWKRPGKMLANTPLL